MKKISYFEVDYLEKIINIASKIESNEEDIIFTFENSIYDEDIGDLFDNLNIPYFQDFNEDNWFYSFDINCLPDSFKDRF